MQRKTRKKKKKLALKSAGKIALTASPVPGPTICLKPAICSSVGSLRPLILKAHLHTHVHSFS